MSEDLQEPFDQFNAAGETQSVKFFDLQLSRFTSAFTDVWHYIAQVNIWLQICRLVNIILFFGRLPQQKLEENILMLSWSLTGALN